MAPGFAFSAVIFLLPYEGMLLTFVKMRIVDADAVVVDHRGQALQGIQIRRGKNEVQRPGIRIGHDDRFLRCQQFLPWALRGGFMAVFAGRNSLCVFLFL